VKQKKLSTRVKEISISNEPEASELEDELTFATMGALMTWHWILTLSVDK
jgi:hypothetical protein